MHWWVDHSLMRVLLLFSSSEAARTAAAAWLAAFDAARAAGAAEEQAHGRADQALRRAMGRQLGAAPGESSILAVHAWVDARPPPLLAG